MNERVWIRADSANSSVLSGQYTLMDIGAQRAVYLAHAAAPTVLKLAMTEDGNMPEWQLAEDSDTRHLVPAVFARGRCLANASGVGGSELHVIVAERAGRLART